MADLIYKKVALALIDEMPTVDSVTVIRCKDCRLSKESCFGDGWRYCMNNQHHHKDSHYCGYAERRTES